MRLTPAPISYFVQPIDPQIRTARILAILSLVFGLAEIGVRGFEAMLSQPLWGNQVYVKAVELMAAIAIIAAAIRTLIRTESAWPLMIAMMVEILVLVANVGVQLFDYYEVIAQSKAPGLYRTMFLAATYHINYAMLPVAVILLLWHQRARSAVPIEQSP